MLSWPAGRREGSGARPCRAHSMEGLPAGAWGCELEFLLGVCHPLAYTAEGGVLDEGPTVLARRLELMRGAGVRWVSCDLPFPFEGRVGRASPVLDGFRGLLARWRDAGLRALGVTPYPAGFEGGWRLDAGRPGGRRFMEVYEEACRFLAQELGGLVSAWQIANQLNLERFRRPMTKSQALEFIRRGAEGVRRADPRAFVGANMFGLGPEALSMYRRLYRESGAELDFAGANGFFGTFDPGGPETWPAAAALVHETTGRPVLVLETGYPSRGAAMTEEERASGRSHHELGKLPFAWRSAHTDALQAEYLERTFWVLMNTPCVLGAFWFAWSDRARCWNCGRPDCPAGTSNGLVDVAGEPKPAYHAFARVSRGEIPLSELPGPSEARPEEVSAELARERAKAGALAEQVRVLREMLASSDRRLARLEGSSLFRAWRILARPLARLAALASGERRHDSAGPRGSQRRGDQRQP